MKLIFKLNQIPSHVLTRNTLKTLRHRKKGNYAIRNIHENKILISFKIEFQQKIPRKTQGKYYKLSYIRIKMQNTKQLTK